MKCYYNLYTNESIREKKLQILKQIVEGKFVVNKYLVVLTQNEQNHLEFFDSAFVSGKIIDKEELFVIGLADGYGGAVKIVEIILNEVLKVTGGTDIRNYLLAQQREYDQRNG